MKFYILRIYCISKIVHNIILKMVRMAGVEPAKLLGLNQATLPICPHPLEYVVAVVGVEPTN